MDAEHRVLCAVLAERSIRALVDAAVTPEHFPTPAHRAAYGAILAHQARYGAVPAPETLAETVPGFVYEKPPEPLAVYLDRLVHNRTRAILETGLLKAVECLEADNLAGSQDVLVRSLRVLAAPSRRGGHMDLPATGADRLRQYRGYRDGESGLRGIPTGFPSVDRATLGFQSGQLIVIGGLPKGGKSTLLGTFARNAHAHAYSEGVELVPLVYTIEMGTLEFAERLDAQFAAVDPHKLRAGELNQAEWIKLERALQRLAAMPSFHLEKGVAHHTTVTEISARVEQHRPDILLVDGVYLMKDELTGDVGTPQALTSLTQSFKAVADTWGIPVVITSQLLRSKVDKKKGADGGSFGWSSSFEMDADVAIVLEETEADDIKLLKIVASRNSPNLSTYLRWSHASAVFEEIEGDPFADKGGRRDEPTW